jgi:mRNA interferase MazF
MAVELKRFDVYLVALDPTLGAEIKKTRPCVVISPDEMNRHIRTVIVAPMTTQRHAYPTRVTCTFEGKKAEIVLDQIRTVDRTRLIKRLGRIGTRTQEQVLSVLADLFAP